MHFCIMKITHSIQVHSTSDVMRFWLGSHRIYLSDLRKFHECMNLVTSWGGEPQTSVSYWCLRFTSEIVTNN